MSPPKSSSKRTAYKPPRDRRELVTAIAVGALIFIVTATLVWFVRPNRSSSSSTPSPQITAPTGTTAPTESTTPTETSAPTDTTAPTESTAPSETTGEGSTP